MRIALLLWLALAQPAGAGACGQALAIGLDVSRSVDAVEYRLQAQGMAAALTDPEVAALILERSASPVRIAVYAWSGQGQHQVIADWTVLTDAATLTQLAATVAATGRARLSASTAVGAALQFGDRLLARVPDCPIRTLDLVGDGKNNTGPGPRDLNLPDTDIVNALAVGPDPRGGFQHGEPAIGELVAWFDTEVRRGPGSFVEAALGYNDFQQAMIRKLTRELAGAVIGWNADGICTGCRQR